MQTLVLDVGFQPTQRVPWEQSIVWVLERVVEVIDEYPDRSINTVNWTVKMPSVVRFLKPIRKKKAVKFSRHNIYARDNGRCQYCGNKVRLSEMQYEHVVPRAQGGKTCWENIVVSCTDCNQRKGGRTPQQAGMHLRSMPVRPKKLALMPRRMDWTPGMPDGWKQWLRSETYWSVGLESDNE